MLSFFVHGVAVTGTRNRCEAGCAAGSTVFQGWFKAGKAGKAGKAEKAEKAEKAGSRKSSGLAQGLFQGEAAAA